MLGTLSKNRYWEFEAPCRVAAALRNLRSAVIGHRLLNHKHEKLCSRGTRTIRTYVLLVPSYPVQLVADLVDLDLAVRIEAEPNQSDLRLVNAQSFVEVSQVYEDEKKIQERGVSVEEVTETYGSLAACVNARALEADAVVFGE